MLLAVAVAHARPDVLVVGNSYVLSNDLDRQIARLLAADPEYSASSTARLADPGLKFVDHVERAGSNEVWGAELVTAAHADWIVYQEQSQIPGFPASEPEVAASRAASATLDGYARAMGAETVWLATWGRRDGDATNPAIFPDFPTMNAALELGYLAYRDGASAADRPTWIAPAGRAWERVYDADVAEGLDPLAGTSLFSRLYQGDGSHPSVQGTYLAACVVVVSITGHTCVGRPGPDGIPAAELEVLQTMGTDAVMLSTDLDFPWEGSGDTDAADTDPVEDTDPVDPIDTDPVAGGDTDKDTVGGGCGCDQAGGAGLISILIAGILVGRRRSR